MSRLNINFGKIMVTDLVDKFTNMVPSSKNKKENETNIYANTNPNLMEKMENGLAEDERLSPFDSNCNQELIAKVTRVFNDYGVDRSGEQYNIEHHEVIYIDGTSKVFEVRTSASGVSINEVTEIKVSNK